jgi:hypothetical protein
MGVGFLRQGVYSLPGACSTTHPLTLPCIVGNIVWHISQVIPPRVIGSGGLSASTFRSWHVHPHPINGIFYPHPRPQQGIVAYTLAGEWPPIFGEGFPLRCFQRLSPVAWLPGAALSDNRYTRGHGAPFLSY